MLQGKANGRDEGNDKINERFSFWNGTGIIKMGKRVRLGMAQGKTWNLACFQHQLKSYRSIYRSV